jgi:DNA-binding response OmpR family regulator
MRAVLLDDDLDLLDCLADVLSLHGWTCVKADSVEALTGLAEVALSADMALLDVNLGFGRRSGIDAYEWLQRNGFTGRIFFVTGHAHSHPLVAHARALGRAAVLEKPLRADQLVERIVENR